jgi:hypothetical protein
MASSLSRNPECSRRTAIRYSECTRARNSRRVNEIPLYSDALEVVMKCGPELVCRLAIVTHFAGVRVSSYTGAGEEGMLFSFPESYACCARLSVAVTTMAQLIAERTTALAAACYIPLQSSTANEHPAWVCPTPDSEILEKVSFQNSENFINCLVNCAFCAM